MKTEYNNQGSKPRQKIKFLTALWMILFFSLSFLPSYTIADTYRLLFIQSDDNEFYQQFTSSLQSNIVKKCADSCQHKNLEVDILNIDEAYDESNYDLIISLGVKAHEQHQQHITNKLNTKYLHALIPLNLTHPKSENHYSLVLDQQNETILAVIKKLISKDQPIGFLYTKNSQWRIDSIKKAANEAQVKIATFLIDDVKHSEIGSALSEFLPHVSSVYMLPDKSLYNRITINEILLTGFIYQTPFIGYSKSIAKTGALASIANDREILIEDISNIITKVINGDDVPAINWPSTYKLIINRQIADSLGIITNESILNNPDMEVIE